LPALFDADALNLVAVHPVLATALARRQAPTLLTPHPTEAARLLAEKGHNVSLWEKDADLGGTARIAALAYEPNEMLVHYLVDAVRALPIVLQLGTTATVENIAAASLTPSPFKSPTATKSVSTMDA
jgi:hypothetical protein